MKHPVLLPRRCCQPAVTSPRAFWACRPPGRTAPSPSPSQALRTQPSLGYGAPYTGHNCTPSEASFLRTLSCLCGFLPVEGKSSHSSSSSHLEIQVRTKAWSRNYTQKATFGLPTAFQTPAAWWQKPPHSPSHWPGHLPSHRHGLRYSCRWYGHRTHTSDLVFS